MRVVFLATAVAAVCAQTTGITFEDDGGASTRIWFDGAKLNVLVRY